MTTTKVQVTACDNELYIIASQPSGSSELLHIKSGYNNPVANTFVPQSILAHGNYTLILIGINWGSAQGFNVIVTTNGVNTTYTAPAGSAVGATWTVAVPITV